MKKTKEYTTWESLPDILTAKHISEFLDISRRRVYELFKVDVEHGGIPCFNIGTSTKRVDKVDFEQFVLRLKKKEQH